LTTLRAPRAGNGAPPEYTFCCATAGLRGFLGAGLRWGGEYLNQTSLQASGSGAYHQPGCAEAQLPEGGNCGSFGDEE
jgi:hypothetical protein